MTTFRISKPVEERQYDLLRMSLRAYVPTGSKPSGWSQPQQGPSEWTLIFDTETTIDAAQKLRFGVYQVRKGQELFEAGYFVNSDALSKRELTTIHSHAKSTNYRVLTVAEFVESVFFGIGYELRATIVGFNLPFDISRLAIGHGNSRGKSMKGGFSFQLSPHKWRPRVQIRHLSSTIALIRFTTRAGQIAGRGMRRRKFKPLPRPGYFVDTHTLAAALASFRGNLANLAKFVETKNQKLSTEDHGVALNDNYLVYACQDVQVTWECYCKLLDRFSAHHFTDTLVSRLFSEASVGKAYFKEMNIRPWRVMQPNFPDHLTGIIMSTYFGGRAEVHHRRNVSQVCYCDFLSMYPTVCTLMGLWQFVIANGVKFRDSTKMTRKFLNSVALASLQQPDIWKKFTTLVQIDPDDDIFPIRANYSGDDQDTIGLNHLGPGQPLWFTLADCIASKLLTGKSPKILKAITFQPDGVQNDLRPVNIAGNPEYRIDPYNDDFYRRVIDQRTAVKNHLAAANPSDRAALDSAQLTLKILANATSYGNFVELNVEDLSKPQRRKCFGSTDKPFEIITGKSEEPGRYFHPLIATLITGAARLMLTTAERLTLDSGLDWAFCDTDSMALVKPESMNERMFQEKAKAIRDWFDELNPYETKGPIFKIEDANFGVTAGRLSKTIEPLYCLAISAKRYALFNLSNGGQITIRKASAHGLGHLLAPYKPENAPTFIPAPTVPLSEIGVERWHYDLWHQIIRATLDGHPNQVDFSFHGNLDKPAASRYGATTPALLGWFRNHNQDRMYADQVRPFNFLLAFQIAPTEIHNDLKFESNIAERWQSKPKAFQWPKPIAPFSNDAKTASDLCFDRDLGEAIPREVLRTYVDSLGQYHLRSEHKFQNGEYADFGITQRRYVKPVAIRQIGKEANRWEETVSLDNGSSSAIHYGETPDSHVELVRSVRNLCEKTGQRNFAKAIGVSRQTVSKIVSGRLASMPPGLGGQIYGDLSRLKKSLDRENHRESSLLGKACAEVDRIGLSHFARKLDVDASNFQKCINGKRNISERMLARLAFYFSKNA